MSYMTETFGAGETKRFSVPGKFLMVVAAVSDMNISLFRGRVKLSETVIGVSVGFNLKLPAGFDEFEIYSAAAQAVEILTSEGEVDFAGSVTIAGSAQVSGVAALITQTTNSVTNSSGQILGANAARKYMLIQNNDPSLDIYVAFGNSATVADGIKIPPGGVFESGLFVSIQQVSAITASGTNNAVITLEG